MGTENFQQKLNDLVKEIDHLPAVDQDRLRTLAEDAQERQVRMKEMINNLTENLDYLRLSVKYLVFDLEATRRENQFLRDLVQNQQQQNEENDPEN